MSASIEFLAPIPGYEQWYLASTHGRIWSNYSNDYLSPAIGIHGYHNPVILCNDGKKWAASVARLVALTFLDPPSDPNQCEVDHIDRDRTNNHVSNLRWATRQENANNIYRRPMVNIYFINGRYRVDIRRQDHPQFLKTFDSKEEAIKARDQFLRSLENDSTKPSP